MVAAAVFFLAGAVSAQTATLGSTPDADAGSAAAAAAALIEQQNSNAMQPAAKGASTPKLGSPEGPALASFAVAPPTPTPLPGALWMFGTALVGFMGFSSRRKI